MNFIDVDQSKLGAKNFTRNIQEPLSENDIIYLQNKFIEPGFHHIKSTDLERDRVLINKILKSLSCFNNIGIVTTNQITEEYFDIYSCLKSEYNIDVNNDNIFLFFLDHSFFDLILIENIDKISKNLFESIEQQIETFNLHKIIPIVTIN